MKKYVVLGLGAGASSIPVKTGCVTLLVCIGVQYIYTKRVTYPICTVIEEAPALSNIKKKG